MAAALVHVESRRHAGFAESEHIRQDAFDKFVVGRHSDVDRRVWLRCGLANCGSSLPSASMSPPG